MIFAMANKSIANLLLGKAVFMVGTLLSAALKNSMAAMVVLVLEEYDFCNRLAYVCDTKLSMVEVRKSERYPEFPHHEGNA